MRWALLSFVIVLAVCGRVELSIAQPPEEESSAPVTARILEDEVWTGQKATLQVQLKGKGPFVGAAGFSIPQVPDTLIVKLGNPVVSSEEKGDQTLFVQTHDFVVFSQRTGEVNISAFEARFSCRDRFTGPEQIFVEQVPATSVTVNRPPESEQLGFIVTSENFTVKESWHPSENSARQGDAFTREITQQADQVTGMALAPPSTTVPEGVKVYAAQPEISDQTERGEFTGNRKDTLTYVFQNAGTFTIPAVQYVWWNPSSKKLETITLPALKIDVAAVPEKDMPVDSSGQQGHAALYWAAGVLLLLAWLSFWYRVQIQNLSRRVLHWLNPPERAARRELLKACAANDATAANRIWQRSGYLIKPTSQSQAELDAAILELERHCYTSLPAANWNGSRLAAALARTAQVEKSDNKHHSALPSLNPDLS